MTYPLRSRELNWVEAYPELKKYPPCQDLLPSFEVIAGNYSVRLAKTFEELDEILKLRFEVFNLELQEGLESSLAIERDYDPYDAFCHHLFLARPNSAGGGHLSAADLGNGAKGDGLLHGTGVRLLGIAERSLSRLSGSRSGCDCPEASRNTRAVSPLEGVSAVFRSHGKAMAPGTLLDSDG
jgi:hypothetical protein